jgi:FkbM family methyltransferase
MDPSVLPPGLVERPLKHIPVSVPVDPYIYVHRNSYWCGVFYEEELEHYMIRELRPGDTVIDVGVNVGHVSLPAAALVAPTGKVYGFEPNPALASLVSDCGARQMLPLQISACGLGERADSFPLSMDPAHTGGATFRATDKTELAHTIMCNVVVGDEVLPPLAGRVFLKVDVEGFEISVLRGLSRTLLLVDHAVLEVSPQWLGLKGVEELFDLMKVAGLDAHQLLIDGKVGPLLAPADVATQINVLFRRNERGVNRVVRAGPLDGEVSHLIP